MPCLALALGLGVVGAIPAGAAPPQAVSIGVPTVVATGSTINLGEERAGQGRERLATVLRGRQSPGAALESPLSDPVLQQAPPATDGFPALPDNNMAWPPNTSGAAGPGYLMVTLNTQVRIQDKTGMQAVADRGLNGFWNTVNNGSGAEDPRVIFEPLGGRWVTVALDDTGSTTDAGLLVGVSWTSDPRGSWQLLRIDAAYAPYLPHRLTIGFNKNWVVVQANMYSGAVLYGSRVYVFDHAQMFENPTPAFSYTRVDLPGALAVVPAATYGAAVQQPEELYLLQTSNPAAATLQLYKLVFDTPPPNVKILPVGPVAELTPVPWADSAPVANFAPQRQGSPGCSAAPCAPNCNIHAGDSRIQNVVYRDGHLWAAHTVFLPATPTPTRSSVQWWEIDPVAVSVADRGLVDDPTGIRFFAYPSIAVNGKDDVLLGYSRFQADDFAGASYSFRTSADPDGTMQSERSLRKGDGCYYKDPASLGMNQWGAYSATVVDPDDRTFWTLQEYAADLPAPDRWGTYWGKLDPTPVIAISNAVVSEPVSGTSDLVFDVSLLSSDLTHTVPFPTSQTVTVDWWVDDGTALAGADYEDGSGTVTFAPGETAKTITVKVYSDGVINEGNETLYVRLGAPAYATIFDGEGVGTIQDLPAPQISVSDTRVTEGGVATFTVRLSYPAPSPFTVDWVTQDGPPPYSASSTSDYFFGYGTLPFQTNDVSKTITVTTMVDGFDEADETFLVVLSNATLGTLLRPVGTGTILDDDGVPTYPPVSDLVAISDYSGASPRIRLRWLNPVPDASAVRVKYGQGAANCGSPPTLADGLPYADVGFSSGQPGGFDHESLVPNETYCYTVFVHYTASWSTGASFTLQTLAASGAVKWKYYTGAGNFVPPTVGDFAVFAPSNDNYIHAMERGPTGGAWPVGWRPVKLGGPAPQRSPLVTLGGQPRAFVTTQDGRVQSIDVTNGTVLWSTLLPEAATAAPAGIFTQFHGAYDYILVGTNGGGAGGDHFYALDPGSGDVIDAFPGPAESTMGSLGPVSGMATVDYANGRVYFASYGGIAGRSLWCLDLGPRSDALRPRWSLDVGDVQGSPVLRNGRVYVANVANQIWSVPAASGVGAYSLPAGSSPVKGFLFPDRNGADFYGATTSEVIAISDDGSSLRQRWIQGTLAGPSMVVLEPGTDNLYVGASNYAGSARVVLLDKKSGTVMRSVALESSPKFVGAPSLDLGTSPDPKMIYVGGELGVLYAVQLPLP